MKKIFFYIFFTSFLVLFSFSLTNAEDILWKDLWLDLYKSVDEWFASLVENQLEYELWWQWKWSIAETVNAILQSDWDDIECKIESVDDIITLADKYAENQLELILEKCKEDWESISMEDANTILRKITSIKMNFTMRAREKSKYMYELSKIWLYSDWDDSNSPFDLMSDLKDIDLIISNNEIEYKEDGINQTIANEVLSKATDLLESINKYGMFTTIEKGIFAGIKRGENNGKGLLGVFEKNKLYFNPILDKMVKEIGGE